MRLVTQLLLFTSFISIALLSQAVEVRHVRMTQTDQMNTLEQIYKKQCSTCHGNNGDGKGRAGASLTANPTDFTSEVSQQRLTTEKILNAIKNGIAGSSMVAYARLFDEKTLGNLTAYIETTFMGRENKPAIPINVAEIETKPTGVSLYIEHCSACHGDKGESAVWAQNGLNPPPRNFTTAQAKEELSLERMVTSVTYGRPGTAMMSFKKRLTKAQIITVVGYIRDNFMRTIELPQIPVKPNPAVEKKREPHPISVDMRAKFTNNLVGNAASGKVFFESNCFTCHGKKGEGNGPRAHFNYPRPRNFISKDSRLIFNRPRLFASISHGKRGSVMPSWKTVLSNQEIADVAEYVFQQFILNKPVVKKKSFSSQ